MGEERRDDQQMRGGIFQSEVSLGAAASHYKRRLLRTLYPFILLLVDCIVLSLIFAFLVSLRLDVGLFDALSRRVLVAIALPSFFALWVIGGYNYAVKKGTARFVAEYLIAAFGASVLGAVLIYSVVAYGTGIQSSRAVVALTFVGFTVCSIVYRYIFARIQLNFEKDSVYVILGDGKNARDLYRRLMDRGDRHEVIVKSFNLAMVGNHLIPDDATSPLIGSAEGVDFGRSVDRRFVEYYVIAEDERKMPEEVARRMVAAAFRSKFVLTYRRFVMKELKIEPPSQVDIYWPMMGGFRLNRSRVYDRVKRLADIAAALFGLILTAPLMLMTAILVKLTSKGPVLFRQQRVGLQEKPFTILKFRSMKVGAEKEGMYTEENDTRLTPIGKFIRKTRLDELPQLWNVLVGDLSLIGPRAEWVDLVEGYEKRLPYYHYRHAVKPGITGWAQVNYSYGANDEDTVEKLNYDLYYVRRYSLSLDMTIVVKTVYMMVSGRGM